MFKKIGILYLLLFSLPALADFTNPASITVTNATGTDCVLTNQIPVFGFLSDPTVLPTALFKDQTITINMRSDEKNRHRKSLLLSYECGENMTATFFTDITPFQGMLVSDGYTLKNNKMQLYFSESQNDTGRFYNKSPLKVHWHLTR